MRIQQYKIIFIVFVLATFSAGAQKTKLLIQEFKVKPNVVIDVNTRYTDIEIETWNKNEVLVEARMKVSGEKVTEEIEDSYYDKWKFDATGNTDKIKIISRTNSIDINLLDLDRNIDLLYNQIEIPDVSIAGLDILDSMDFELPELPELPEIVLPELPPLPPMPREFDFDAYKKDKSYLERWKKENKDVLGNKPKVSVRGKSIIIKSDTKNGYYNWNYSNDDEEKVEELEKRMKAYKKRQEEYKQRQKEYQQRMKERLEANRKRVKASKKRNEARKLALIKRKEAHEKRRKEMQVLLKNRSNYKVKRVIKIRAPKDAKFNMNVKYGSMSFPKN